MPAIQFLQTVPTPSGPNAPAVGMIEFTPTRSFNGPGAAEEVMPKPFRIQLDSNGAASVNLAVTNTGWCWRVDMFITGVPSTTTYVTVKTTDTQWPSLTRVDPIIIAPPLSPSWITDNGDGTFTLTF